MDGAPAAVLFRQWVVNRQNLQVHGPCASATRCRFAAEVTPFVPQAQIGEHQFGARVFETTSCTFVGHLAMVKIVTESGLEPMGCAVLVKTLRAWKKKLDHRF